MHLFKLNLSFLGLEMRDIEVMSHVYNAFPMFLSFHQPMTKCQTPNVTWYFVVILLFEKRRESLSSSLFELRQQNSLADIWCLVFSYQLMQRNRFDFPNRRTKKFIAILCITLLSIDHIVWIYTYLYIFLEIPPEFLWLSL